MQYCFQRSKRDYISRKDAAAQHNIENQSPNFLLNFDPEKHQAYIHTPILPGRYLLLHMWLLIAGNDFFLHLCLLQCHFQHKLPLPTTSDFRSGNAGDCKGGGVAMTS